MSRNTTIGLLALPLLALMTACSETDESSRHVARVGNKIISVDEFERRANTLLRRGYRDLDTLDITTQMTLLDGIIAQELLVKEALERGFGRDSTIVEEVERTEQRALIDTLYARQAPRDEYTVTDEELQHFFSARKFDIQVRSQQIVCSTEEEAWKALRELQNGESFSSLVPRYSLSHIQERFGPDGDIGWFRMNEMLEPLREPMRTMEVDSIYPRPIRSRLGYHAFRLTDRRTIPFDSVRDWVETQLRYENSMIDKVNYVAELRERYELKAHGEAIRQLLELPGEQKYWHGPDQPLFTWNGGHLPISFYMAMHRRGRVKHPASLDSSELHHIADNLAGHRIMTTEARRLGYDHDPDIRAAVESRRNELLLSTLLRNQIRDSGIRIGEPEIRAYYEAHIDRFSRSDGTIVDISDVTDTIRHTLQQQAENALMDNLIAELRIKYQDDIDINHEMLARSFSTNE